jgi:gamma-glutamyltranspeptidase
VLNVESRIPADVISKLGSRGHKMKIQSGWATGSSPTIIMYDPKTGVISGGADPRRGRYAVAW